MAIELTILNLQWARQVMQAMKLNKHRRDDRKFVSIVDACIAFVELEIEAGKTAMQASLDDSMESMAS